MNKAQKLEQFNKLYEKLSKLDCDGIDCYDCPFNNGITVCHIII